MGRLKGGRTDGRTDGCTDVRTYGRMDVRTYPHSTGLRPLPGPLPKKGRGECDVRVVVYLLFFPSSLTLELRSWPVNQRDLSLQYAKSPFIMWGVDSGWIFRLNTDYDQTLHIWDFVPGLLSSTISE